MTVLEWPEGEVRVLRVLLGVLIPPSSDGMRPSASEMDLAGFPGSDDDEAFVRDLVRMLQADAEQAGMAPFAERSPDAQIIAVERLARQNPLPFRQLLQAVVGRYYTDPLVLQALGVGARPPFPDGYGVIDGDLTLLSPVFERGSIYRR